MTPINVSRRAAVVASFVLVAATGLSAGPADAAPASAPAGRSHTVTLVTGDRVTVSRPDATTARIDPAPGREHITFTTSVLHGHLLVVPADAVPLLHTQRADRRLFDVTELVRLRYDDAARRTVPLIVKYRAKADVRGTKQAITAAGGKIGRELPAVRGVAITARKAEAKSLWDTLKTTSQQIWLDGVRQRVLDVSVPQIGAPAAWQAGYTGKGLAVAVLDGGVDAEHPDLKGKVTSQNFSAEPTAGDTDGHGTHVASTIAGTGAASGGKYKGVAPDATILNGKVCELRGCTDSAILAGMYWAAAEQHARVINMSLGGEDFAGIDPMEEAVNTLSAQTRALFVIAAGNSGADETIGSPGSADAALTVGAVDKSDRTAEFSSRGARSFDGAIKPDIAAPGVDIVAARSAGSEIGTPAADYPETYQSLSGTSMATPHVAGAAALLAQQHPDWNGARLKTVLMASAKPDGAAGPFEQGAGRVDVARAITQTLTSEPAAVSFGLRHWPHDKDTALTKTVTYRNTGTADVTAALALTGSVFRLSATSVTIPAGGSADVTVTADTTGDVAPGAYTGRIIATAGTSQVSTPVAVQKEDERYAVTLRNIGPDGKLTPNNLAEIYQPTGDYFALPWDPSGQVTLRLPKGRYSVGSYIYSEPTEDSPVAVMFQPVVDVTGDTTVTFDARTAAPVSQAVPDKTAESLAGAISVTGSVDGSAIGFGTTAGSLADVRVGMADPSAPGQPELTGAVSSAWARKDSGRRGLNSPYAYFVSEYVPGRTLLAGEYRRTFRAAELATEVQTIRAVADGDTARQYATVYNSAGGQIGGGSVAVGAPATRVNYFSTDPAMRWELETQIGSMDEMGFMNGPFWRDTPRVHRAGERKHQVWGAAPWGVAFNSRYQWLARRGGTINAVIPQSADGAGHPGFDNDAEMTSRIYRDGELIGDYEGSATGADGLPDAESTYRIEQTVTSPGYAGLSTSRSVAFTFRSAKPAGDEWATLPVFAVRYQPSVDASNSVPGGPGVLPLWAQDQTGAKVAVRALAADVSFDDGKTWRKLPVGPGGLAHVTYPKGKGYVSLRLSAADGKGSSVAQTVIRAYRFK
ncbi:S8 family serine peptidase [Actinoplanes sp. NPDC049265]|uniref:S8 family serine peptidase n=1 Tax=Actinoplanes sp. NPDC049265 TaxID=3363902 RepID=UPI003713EDC1